MAKNKKNEEHLSRTIVLGEINDENVNEAIGLIFDINKEDATKSIEIIQPIELIINSHGGDVYSALGLIDTIEMSKTPIHTIAMGRVMSAALPIFISGHKRFSTRKTTFMYHELWWETAGEKLKYHKQEAEEGTRVQNIIDSIIVGGTSIKQHQLDSIKKHSSEWYINAEDAVRLGIVDEIIQ